MMFLFVDTSAWFSYINKADPDYEIISQCITHYNGRLLLSNFVFDETITLCLYRLGFTIAKTVGEILQKDSKIDIFPITREDEEEAWKLFCQRADKQYSYTDCTSFILLRRLKLQQVLATDKHFQQEGFESYQQLSS